MIQGNRGLLGSLRERARATAPASHNGQMPRDLPIVPGLRLHARYRPAGEATLVGGDWYDAFALGDGRLFIVVGDVIGHGIAAAASMHHVRHAILAAALYEGDPSTILMTANGAIMQGATEPAIATVVCAIVNAATRKITYATAGHPPPILVDPESGAEFLAIGGLPLGVGNDAFHTRIAQAPRGALLVFYTDGLIETTRNLLEGELRLLDAAQRVAGRQVDNPALSIKEQILGDSMPLDDIAILTVGFELSRRAEANGAPVGQFESTFVDGIQER